MPELPCLKNFRINSIAPLS